MSAGCSDGHGGASFHEALSKAESPESILREVLKRGRGETVPDQWQYQILARILKDHRVIMYAPECPRELLESMKLEVAGTPEEALHKAFSYVGPKGQVAVIPEGVSVIPVRKKREA